MIDHCFTPARQSTSGAVNAPRRSGSKPSTTATQLLLALTLPLAWGTQVFAQSTSMTTIGAGLEVVPRYEGSSTYHADPFPIISASSGAFFIDDLDGGVAYAFSPHLKVGAILSVDFGRDESDGARLKGLGDIDSTAAYGGFVDWKTGAFDTSAKYLQSTRYGYGATLTLTERYGIAVSSRDHATLEADTVWADRNSMQTFFGVTPGQAADSVAGLPAYSPSAGFKRVTLSGSWTHVLSPSWVVNGNLGVSSLLGDAARSPIVDHKAWIFGGVGLAYSFR